MVSCFMLYSFIRIIHVFKDVRKLNDINFLDILKMFLKFSSLRFVLRKKIATISLKLDNKSKEYFHFKFKENFYHKLLV